MKLTKEQQEFIKSTIHHPDVCEKWKDTIIKNFPKLFNFLEVGKWYKSGKNILLCVTSNQDSDNWYESYGFNIDGDWMTGNGQFLDDGKFKPATKEEVEQALLKEAKKRGFKDGVKIKRAWDSETQTLKNCYNYGYYPSLKTFDIGNWQVFEDGVWAEIIENKLPTKLQEAIDEIGKEEILNLLKHS